jgi:hypothetical protein
VSSECQHEDPTALQQHVGTSYPICSASDELFALGCSEWRWLPLPATRQRASSTLLMSCKC